MRINNTPNQLGPIQPEDVPAGQDVVCSTSNPPISTPATTAVAPTISGAGSDSTQPAIVRNKSDGGSSDPP